MILGEFRGLALDRTGIALLGAIALVAAGRLSMEEAWAALDFRTLALLFGLMVVSAQFRLGGFYTRVARRQAQARSSPPVFLAQVIALAAGLSALLANDIVCLALAPPLIEGCARRRLQPVPYLLALACASNAGSAATLIGNPQNMLIGQALGLSFAGYLLEALPPALLGLAVTWGVIVWRWRGRWEAPGRAIPAFEAPRFDAWQTSKGLGILAALVAAFLFAWAPREALALAAAGALLLSRRMASRRFIGLVDWNLLMLFAGLFVVNHALQASGWLDAGLGRLRAVGVDLDHAGWLFTVTALLSNLVSNVPAVMLLLPATAHPHAGLILALVSTLAGNLFIVGSIANIIVVDQAGALGVRITWREHARIGVPVTLLSLALTALWLALLY